MHHQEKSNNNKQKSLHFLQFSCCSIKTLYNEWITQLCFLGIWCDQPMGKLFIRRIMSNIDGVRNELCYYEIHKHNISLPKFDCWIQSNVSNTMVTTTRALPCIRNNSAAIWLVASGLDTWSPHIICSLLQVCIPPRALYTPNTYSIRQMQHQRDGVHIIMTTYQKKSNHPCYCLW